MTIKEIIEALDGYGIVCVDEELVEERIEELGYDPDADIITDENQTQL